MFELMCCREGVLFLHIMHHVHKTVISQMFLFTLIDWLSC